MADVYNSTNNTVISGERWRSNNIYNTGNNVTINANNYYNDSDAIDYIDNSGSNVVIYAENYHDEIMNRAGGSNSFIDTGSGNDRVTNYGKNTTIFSGSWILACHWCSMIVSVRA